MTSFLSGTMQALSAEVDGTNMLHLQQFHKFHGLEATSDIISAAHAFHSSEAHFASSQWKPLLLCFLARRRYLLPASIHGKVRSLEKDVP